MQELTTGLIKCGNETVNRHVCVWGGGKEDEQEKEVINFIEN